jgi:hypothetical protein
MNTENTREDNVRGFASSKLQIPTYFLQKHVPQKNHATMLGGISSSPPKLFNSLIFGAAA